MDLMLKICSDESDGAYDVPDDSSLSSVSIHDGQTVCRLNWFSVLQWMLLIVILLILCRKMIQTRTQKYHSWTSRHYQPAERDMCIQHLLLKCRYV